MSHLSVPLPSHRVAHVWPDALLDPTPRWVAARGEQIAATNRERPGWRVAGPQQAVSAGRAVEVRLDGASLAVGEEVLRVPLAGVTARDLVGALYRLGAVLTTSAVRLSWSLGLRCPTRVAARAQIVGLQSGLHIQLCIGRRLAANLAAAAVLEGFQRGARAHGPAVWQRDIELDIDWLVRTGGTGPRALRPTLLEEPHAALRLLGLSPSAVNSLLALTCRH